MKSYGGQHMTASDTALVFDIQRFAVHDGDGIRTTVFFKGCPLHCIWCQNPEGINAKRQVMYLKTKCIHCKTCENKSFGHQLNWVKDHPELNFNYYGTFDNLIKACPSGAIRYDSAEMTADEILRKIREDKVFYRDNGGVTFSGGEPLQQGAFLLNLLKRCKEEGIHTAIETSLCAPTELVMEILPYLDQIYADMKFYNPEDHQKYTGADNRIIRYNIKQLLESEARDRTVIRTPLIPNVTAQETNIRAIASYLSGIYPDVTYELLNYNDLAGAKYPMIGRSFGMPDNTKRFKAHEMKKYYKAAMDGGIKNLITETRAKRGK